MKRIRQDLATIAASLTELQADWMDATAGRIIAAIGFVPEKKAYDREDLSALLSDDFGTGLTICRLFLGLSRDELENKLRRELEPGGVGVERYEDDQESYLGALDRLGVLEAMTELVNRPLRWSDLLIERLRSGRGRAIRGQARGRSLEDFTERIVMEVFGPTGYAKRCSFTSKDGTTTAKADFAIPAKNQPRIVIESKGYGATGSKQSDVLGDLNAIIAAKRHDTTFLFVTDGVSWRQRLSDLQKIVELQNTGEVARIYTRAMEANMRADFLILKREHDL